jgi:type IV pilus assembly protein PilP
MMESMNKTFPEKEANTAGPMRLMIAIAACAVLVSCASSDHSDLKAYVDSVIARQKPKIEPLPEFKPYPIYVYEAGELRDPFQESAFVEQQVEVAIEGSGIRPPERDTREPLEEYPLDVLRMVGTLEQSATMWALIKDGEGSIHRVKTGNYMGKNYGKILSINEHKVEILEIVPNGLGAYIERPATIALSE